MVGEFAVHLALRDGPQVLLHDADQGAVEPEVRRPRRRYGADKVGLLTGDNTINGDAPVVVMTTEVLRNMLYAGSRTLLGLGFVVMDEVHYLADRFRGAVWEEVIIHLPESVSLVSLSATVSNAEEFGDWLADRARRHHHGRRGAPPGAALPARDGRQAAARPVRRPDVDAAAGFVKEGAPVNPELVRLARDDWASNRMKDRRTPGRGRGGSPAGDRQAPTGRQRPAGLDPEPRRRGRRASTATGCCPRSSSSSAGSGCDAAVQQCVRPRCG